MRYFDVPACHVLTGSLSAELKLNDERCRCNCKFYRMSYPLSALMHRTFTVRCRCNSPCNVFECDPTFTRPRVDKYGESENNITDEDVPLRSSLKNGSSLESPMKSGLAKVVECPCKCATTSRGHYNEVMCDCFNDPEDRENRCDLRRWQCGFATHLGKQLVVFVRILVDLVYFIACTTQVIRQAKRFTSAHQKMR